MDSNVHNTPTFTVHKALLRYIIVLGYNAMGSVFDYLDYRDYLKDHYENRKRDNPWYSYRLMAQRIGIDASYLAKVLIKTRHIASKSIPGFISHLKLKDRESEYFEVMVNFAKARTDKEAKVHFEKLLSLKQVSANTLTKDQLEFYRKWYHSVIRSLLEYYEFDGTDYESLAKQLSPAITAQEAKDSVQLLERLGLICKDKKGRYVLTHLAITTGTEFQPLLVRAFQEDTLTIAREALSRHPKSVRDVSTITMNITEESFNELRAMIRQFKDSVISYVNGVSPVDRVYQLNIQLVPLTRIPKPEQPK